MSIIPFGKPIPNPLSNIFSIFSFILTGSPTFSLSSESKRPLCSCDLLHLHTFTVFQHHSSCLQWARSSAMKWPKLTRRCVFLRDNVSVCVCRKRRSCWMLLQCVLACVYPYLYVLTVCFHKQQLKSLIICFSFGWGEKNNQTWRCCTETFISCREPQRFFCSQEKIQSVDKLS